MKFMIASDIHGSAHYCRLLCERAQAEAPGKLILLGDLLYHGARNPLPSEYSTLETAALLNRLKEKIICVRGNCDSEVDSLVLEFPIQAQVLAIPLETGGVGIFTHGHKSVVCLGKGDVLFNGHFHVPAFERREQYLYVNCGSVSIPKENSPHSYLVLDGRDLFYKDVETGSIFRRERL